MRKRTAEALLAQLFHHLAQRNHYERLRDIPENRDKPFLNDCIEIHQRALDEADRIIRDELSSEK